MDFVKNFEAMHLFNVTITLKSEENPEFSKVFNVDFRALEYIGNDLKKMLPNPVELMLFRITPFEQKINQPEFYTSRELCDQLLKYNALFHLLTENRIKVREAYRQSLKRQEITDAGTLKRMFDFIDKANELKKNNKEISK